MLNHVVFCADPKAKPIRDLAALAKPVVAVDPFTFPEWSYTQTEQYSGVVTTYTTRSRWINGKLWSDADIVFYEKLKAAQEQFDADTVHAAIADVESSEASVLQE